MGTTTLCETVAGLLAYRAHAQPHAPFLVVDDELESQCLSYAEVHDVARRGAGLLSELGVRPGDRVLLAVPNSLDFFVVWFGAAMMGAVVVPVDPRSSGEDIDFVLRHARCRAAFVDATSRDTVAPVAAAAGIASVVGAAQRAAEQDPTAVAPVDVAPRAPLAVMYTSGTTSRPKGVVVSQANYTWAGEAVAQSLRMRPDDRWLVVLPLHHANAQYYCVMSALVTGASVAVMHRFSASRWPEQVRRHEATLASLFAAPVRMILAHGPRPLDRDNQLRATLFAQNLTDEQVQDFEQRFDVPLLQLYGMTETIAPPLMNRLYGRRDHTTIGLPIPGARLRVVDDADGDVAAGEPGELLVWGEPGLSQMMGYLDDAGATEAAVQDGWLRTGDIVRVRDDGMYVFLDRKKDMIKRSGENVAAAEVERVVHSHAAVSQSAAIGVPDPIRDERIVVFVVLKEGAQAEASDIVDHCARKLPAFKVPDEVLFTSSLPATAVGKVQKHRLRLEFASHPHIGG